MTPIDREQLRLSLLRYLGTNPSRFGLTSALLRQFATSEGQDADLAAIEAEMQYLVDKGLAVAVVKALSPEIGAWRITASGRDQLALSQAA